METHAVLAERQQSNALGKGRFREGTNRKAHAYGQKQPILSRSALEIGKNYSISLLHFSFLMKLPPSMLQV